MNVTAFMHVARLLGGRAARKPVKRWHARSLLAGAAIGAAVGAGLEYLFDPERGRKRRHVLRDRAGGVARREARRLVRAGRATALRVGGRAKGIAHELLPHPVAELDDVELSHKVESILFRDPAVPKGRISVNAERGMVFLRGEVDRPELIRELEETVRKIDGVKGVENLLHLPGTPAPASQGGRLVA